MFTAGVLEAANEEKKKNQDKIAQNPLFWVHKRKCSPSRDMPMSHVILLSLWALSTFCNIDIFCLHLYLLIWALVEAIYCLSLLLPCSPLFYFQRYTLNCNCAYICLGYTVKARIIFFICMGPTSTLNTKSVGKKKRRNETQTQFALSWHKLHGQLRTKILFSHLGENGYMYMCGWVPSLFTWNYHIVIPQ